MQGKRISLVCVILLFLVSSCGKVNIKDAEFCGNLGILGAECFHAFSEKHRSMNYSQWKEESFGMICTRSENFANWKAAIMALCKNTGQCNKKVEKKVKKLDRRVQQFRIRSEKVERKLRHASDNSKAK